MALHPKIASVETIIRASRHQGDGAVEILHRVLASPDGYQAIRPVVVGFGVIRLRGYRHVVIGKRRRTPSECGKRIAPVIKGD